MYSATPPKADNETVRSSQENLRTIIALGINPVREEKRHEGEHETADNDQYRSSALRVRKVGGDAGWGHTGGILAKNIWIC